MLAKSEGCVLESLIRAVADLAKSPSGLLWGRIEGPHFSLLADWELAVPESPDRLGGLTQWLERTGWIIDLKEWRASPDLYDDLDVPDMILEIPRAWLIVPLMLGEELQGILLLRESDLQQDLNWEDRDLLKVAGRQAASHLAQYQANQALLKSRQFEAFNRLSAYVIHDLKNILAQQSLIVSNAAKHRDNPAFVDDVIDTVENSVARMTRLMDQMRSGVRGAEQEELELCSLLREIVAERAKVPPSPSIETCSSPVTISGDQNQLATVFNHIIQNAQEAAGKQGKVQVHVSSQGGRAVVGIEDDGVGMSDEFLRDRLFEPFESTKGLTGMGIGAFESREVIRALGGDIRVRSTPGQGSVFTVEIPLESTTQADLAMTGTER
jgi:putative PEP-CTERM system histidine kinase